MDAKAFRFMKYGILPPGEDRDDWFEAESNYIDWCKEERQLERSDK